MCKETKEEEKKTEEVRKEEEDTLKASQEETLKEGGNPQEASDDMAGTPSEDQEAPTQIDMLRKELEEQTLQAENWKNKYLYLSAEFDNYRKRTIREKADLILNGGEKAITAILPILDDLERALESKPEGQEAKGLVEGISLIHDKFLRTLNQMGVKVIETKDQELNTDFHEAIAAVPGPENLKGRIIDTVQTGYMLNDKVIRHAKVAVGN